MKDFAALIENAAKRIDAYAVETFFVGYDECLNRKEIQTLVSDLCDRGLIRSHAPLWWEQRLRSDGSLLYSYGGVSRSNPTQMAALDGDAGVPVKYQSYEDRQVVDYLVTHFLSYGRLIVLTENTRNNDEGLRRILNEEVAPLLEASENKKFGLTVLFKRGKTQIHDYCVKVASLMETESFDLGYKEILI